MNPLLTIYIVGYFVALFVYTFVLYDPDGVFNDEMLTALMGGFAAFAWPFFTLVAVVGGGAIYLRRKLSESAKRDR